MDSFNCKTQCQTSLGNTEIRIGCSATVGDLDKCYEEMVQVTNVVLGKVKCGMTLASLTNLRNELSPSSVASCQAIAEKCERFWDGKSHTHRLRGPPAVDRICPPEMSFSAPRF